MEIKGENKSSTISKINNVEFVNLKDSVKSIYIQKLIFSFLEEKTKLNMIKYNKEYKKLLEINIDNYKNKSGRLKIG